MSALGHKQTFRSALAMSALPPKADIRRRYLTKGGIAYLMRTALGGAQLCIDLAQRPISWIDLEAEHIPLGALCFSCQP